MCGVLREEGGGRLGVMREEEGEGGGVCGVRREEGGGGRLGGCW